MYNRLNGTPFTVKNKAERMELIERINEHKGLSNFFKCVGLGVEQFTGKIQYALLKMGNNLVKYEVSGTFPVLKLSNDESSNVFMIEFPNEAQKEKVNEIPKIKIPEEFPAAEFEKSRVVAVRKPEPEPVVEEKKEEPVKEEIPVEPISAVEEPKKEEKNEIPVIQDIKKVEDKKTRKKKVSN